MNDTQRSTPDIVRQILTVVAIVATFLVNAWSNLFPINGMSIGEIANTNFAEVLVIPANYAFAIWGVIYVGLIAFGIYQLQPSQRQNPILRRVDYLLIASCVVQALWVVFFLLRQFWLSVVAMLGILLLLIGIYLQLKTSPHRVNRQEKWCAQIPFSIYLGWISVATIVNIASALYDSNWNGGISPEIWAVILMLIGATIAIVITLRYQDIAYPLVLVWALVAIAVRQSAFPLVSATAVGLSIAVTGVALTMWFRGKRITRQT